MKLRQIDLCGTWTFKSFVGEDWVWRNSEKPDTKDVRWWQTGNVPGSVHYDLWTNGAIPTPYFEQNSLMLEWIPARTWLYRKEFFMDESLQGKRLNLHFAGVDYEAKFYLNGEFLGDHKGMFTPVNFDISSRVKFGETNLLAVVIQPAPFEQPQVGRTSLVTTHKSRLTYWWDFCPRMIHLGIWDRVYIEVTDEVWFQDVFVRPTLDSSLQRAHLEIEFALGSRYSCDIEIGLKVFLGDILVAQHEIQEHMSATTSQGSVSIPVENPALWWPNGYGKQHLYRLVVVVHRKDALEPSDSWVVPFGIRKVEWVPNETSHKTARPYQLVVNHQPIYIKGWNWVPMDVLYGVEQPSKLSHLMHLAQQANVNMLRVWGGGLIEKAAFYEWCDRLGIMVWQEFSQSSSGIENVPSTDPGFISMMVQEAEAIIPRKRNHPSLVIWCGGNELQDLEEKPLDNRSPVLKALSKVVKRLDPDRYWLPTSPTGPLFGNTLQNITENPTGLHDVHGPWEHQGLIAHYTLYNEGTSLLHSEFGVEGMTNKRTLDKTMGRDKQWPATRDNPTYFHLGSWWNNEPLVQASFGGVPDIEQLIHCSQYMQYEGLRYALEANRRRKYQNSGSLPWQFNEPYPNAFCTAAIDYYGRPKPAYYGVKRAYEPITVTAQFSRQTWYEQSHFECALWVNSSLDSGRGVVEASLRAPDGTLLARQTTETKDLKGNTATFFGDFVVSLKDISTIFFLELRLKLTDGREFANNYAFSRNETLAPFLALAPTKLRLDLNPLQEALTVRNIGATVAFLVSIEDCLPLEQSVFVRFADNYFTLFPGESREVGFTWCNTEKLPLKVKAWNTETYGCTHGGTGR